MDSLCRTSVTRSGASLLVEAHQIEPTLGAYLASQAFAPAWDRIRQQTSAPAQQVQRFHEWFDAFRTLKCTHYLRDNGFPRCDLFETLGQLMTWQGITSPVPMKPALRNDLNGQRALLTVLRTWRSEDAPSRATM